MISSANRRTAVAVAVGILACAPALWFRQDIQQAIMVWQILRQDHVDVGVVEELTAAIAEPLPWLQRLWESGRIPHRLAAVRTYNALALADRDTSPSTPDWIMAAGRDLDLSVREPALNLLVFRDAVRAQPLLARALHDTDPEVRLLALRHMRSADFQSLASHVMPQLDHPDLRVALAADAVLRAWTGRDQGVRLARLAGNWNETTGMFDPLTDSEIAMMRLGLQQWNAWWAGHRTRYPEMAIPTDLQPGCLAAPGFELRDLDDKPVRLADFRGRPVLLSFWATWCSGCREDLPHLIELQQKHARDFAILGISLDTPNDQANAAASADSGEVPAGDPVQDRVRRFVKSRGINYRVVLDPAGQVADAYASQELPTMVLVDAQGQVRRRFVGGRTVTGYQSMLAEIGAAKVAAVRPGTAVGR